MSALTVEFPESLHRSIKALAEKEGYSVDHFLASAAAEKLAALMTVDYLRREAAQGGRVTRTVGDGLKRWAGFVVVPTPFEARLGA